MSSKYKDTEQEIFETALWIAYGDLDNYLEQKHLFFITNDEQQACWYLANIFNLSDEESESLLLSIYTDTKG